MLDDYVLDLQARGKVKAKEIKQSFKNNISDPFPDLVAKPAREITAQDIASILKHFLNSPPRKRGIGNTTPAPANDKRESTRKLHTYLTTAFTLARSHEAWIDGDPVVPNRFVLFSNPAEGVRQIDAGKNSAK